MHIKQLITKSIKKLLIDDLSKRFIESSNGIKIKMQRRRIKAHKKGCEKCVTRL